MIREVIAPPVVPTPRDRDATSNRARSETALVHLSVPHGLLHGFEGAPEQVGAELLGPGDRGVGVESLEERVQARDDAGVLGCLTLRVTTVGWDGDYGVLGVMAPVSLGGLLRLGQHHGESLLLVLVFHNIGVQVAWLLLDHLYHPVLCTVLQAVEDEDGRWYIIVDLLLRPTWALLVPAVHLVSRARGRLVQRWPGGGWGARFGFSVRRGAL